MKPVIVIFLLAMAVMASMFSRTASAAGEEDRVINASAEGFGVTMRNAPHTGAKICELSHGTDVRFISPARHGPHLFAKVEVKEGPCAGNVGFVPLASLAPAADGE